MPDSGTFIWSFHERSWWNQPVPVEMLNQGSRARSSELEPLDALGQLLQRRLRLRVHSGLNVTTESTPSSTALRASFFSSSSG